IRALLPSSAPAQVVFDESSSSDRLSFSLRKRDGQRTGVWSGAFDGVHRLVYGFRVKLTEQEPGPSPDADLGEAERKQRWGMPEVDYPADVPEVKAVLDRLALLDQRDPLGRVRALQAFVVEEVALVET